MEKSKSLCQSCGIPLDDKAPRGTKKDGSLSEKYAYNLKRFKASDMSKIEKFFLTKMYTKKFMRKLERWVKY